MAIVCDARTAGELPGGGQASERFNVSWRQCRRVRRLTPPGRRQGRAGLPRADDERYVVIELDLTLPNMRKSSHQFLISQVCAIPEDSATLAGQPSTGLLDVL